MPISIVIKFGEDLIRIVRVRERSSLVVSDINAQTHNDKFLNLKKG